MLIFPIRRTVCEFWINISPSNILLKIAFFSGIIIHNPSIQAVLATSGIGALDTKLKKTTMTYADISPLLSIM